MNIVIVGIHSSEKEIDIDILVQAASFAAFLLWVLMLYWIRLSPKLSFYVDIVMSSIIDIRYFLFMLCLMIMTFSNALYILDYKKYNYSEGNVDKYESFITDVSEDTFFNLFVQ
jgi:hypothetical protein